MSLKQQKILVVDDALFTRKFISKTIQEMGFENVHFAEDGLEAIKKAEEIKPDLVTLDIAMPGMSGLDVVEKIKEVSSNSKVIMISSAITPYTVMQAIKNGAIDFIAKPFNKMEIEQCILKHV